MQRSLLSYLLYPFSLINQLIARLRRATYSLVQKEIDGVILICIGNISSGGTGKTPFVIFLAQQLLARDYRIAIVSRGYKGNFEKSNHIISDYQGVRKCALNAGDEPYMIANRLKNVPVVVGKDRLKSIDLLLRELSKPDIIIFDDAFQYLKIKYDYKFLVFNGESPIGNGFVLPAGILREPLSFVKKSDYIVYNSYTEIPGFLKTFDKPTLRLQYRITNLSGLSLNELAIKRIALLSAIGTPKAFEKTVEKAELSFVKHFIYPDHYAFDDITELQRIKSIIQREKIDYLICTEKDSVKLSKVNHQLPIIIAYADFVLDTDDQIVLNSFLDSLQKGKEN
ncbi:MAG: tetraacyldisaccharide 4'-kinase [Candidatus Cloacimonetes bacterium]|nr:tetraacyldisaccharide 4'-kinase [Candidatus Cloacimonadota bacterium]